MSLPRAGVAGAAGWPATFTEPRRIRLSDVFASTEGDDCTWRQSAKAVEARQISDSIKTSCHGPALRRARRSTSDRPHRQIRHQDQTRRNEMSIANAMQTSGTRTGPLAARKCLLLSAVLLVGGFIVGWIVSLFHAGGITDPNNHPAVFAIYAQSGIWTTVHLADSSRLRSPLPDCSSCSMP